ncbi:MAG: peptidoglycan recognition family protein [bacterium]
MHCYKRYLFKTLILAVGVTAIASSMKGIIPGLSDEHEPTLPVTVHGGFGCGGTDFHVLPPSEADSTLWSIQDTLRKQVESLQQRLTLPENVVIDVFFGRYCDIGWSVEYRALDGHDGSILAAWANHNHRDGCYFLREWILEPGRLERLLERAHQSLGTKAERDRVVVAVDINQWSCEGEQEYARASAERLASELCWTEAVDVVLNLQTTSSSGPEIDFLVRSKLGRTNIDNSLHDSPDVLTIEVVQQPLDTVVLQKTFIREPCVASYSNPTLEAPLSNVWTAARCIAAFVNSRHASLPEEPTIRTRSEWGAREPRSQIEAMRYSGPPDRFFNWIVIHHTAYTPTEPKEVQNEHMLPKGTGQGKHPLGRNWHDVGYHFMIGSDGTVYEGRSLKFIGSHAGGTREGKSDIRLRADFGAIGIAVFGNFDSDEPTKAQIESLQRLLNYLCWRYTILPDHVLGHRKAQILLDYRGVGVTGAETICPGQHLEAVVANWYASHGSGSVYWY